MKSLIVVDSVFGNTEQIARAMEQALRARGEVALLRPGEVRREQLEGVELLLVGSPTRGFRPTPATASFLTRTCRGALRGVKVAAFDTRFNVAHTKSKALRLLLKVGGWAAPGIDKKLRKHGADSVLAPEGFFVKDEKGPLEDGELERAAEWAHRAAKAVGVEEAAP